MKTVRVSLLFVAVVMTSLAVGQVRPLERIAFNIDEQALGSALRVFATQAKIQVLRRDEDVSINGVSAPAVRGTFTAQQALDRLLAGSGLTYEFINERMVKIARQPYGAMATARQSSVDHSSEAASALESAEASVGSSEPLTEVVVTAQKREERLMDVPISISVLSGQQLDRLNEVSVNEALNFAVPGVATSFSSYPGTTSLSARGVTAARMTFSGSSPIAYYVDSVPFGFVRSAMVPDVGGYDLQQVEVLRGPQGTLYGANALNGVVRVLTNDANLNKFEFKSRAGLSTTKDGGNGYRGDAALNIPLIEGTLAARVALSYAKTGGWIDTLVSHDTNDSEATNARLKLNARPTDELSLGLSYWHSRTDIGAFDLATDNDVYPGIMKTPTRIDFDTVGFKVGYEFSGFSVSSMTSHIDYRNHNNYDITPFAALWGIPEWYGQLGFNKQDSNVFSEEIVLNSSDAGAWRWTVGAFYRDAEDHTLQQAVYFTPSLDFGDKSRSAALFGELTRKFMNGKLELTGGLRYFHDEVTAFENVLHPGALPGTPLQHDVDTFHKVSPRAVLTWHVDPQATAYASFGEGFRSGFSQLALIKEIAPSFAPAKPDTLRNYEVGMKGILLGGRLHYDTAVYYIDWKDVQQGVVVQLPSGAGQYAILNGQAASGPGIDAQLDLQLPSGFESGATLSWNDLTFDHDVESGNLILFKKGDRLASSVKLTAGAMVGYVFPLGGAGLKGHIQLSGSYHSRQTSLSLTNLATFTGDNLIDSRASFSVSSERKWNAEFFVDNVTNNRADVARDTTIPFYQLRRAPRTLGLQIEYRY